MAESIEVKGKSVDEAIFNGLMQLGLGIDEVDIEILEEGGRKFLGIGKNACVRLTKREPPAYMSMPETVPEPEPAEPEIVTEESEREEAPRQQREQRERRERKPRQQQKRRENSDREGGHQRRSPRGRQERDRRERREGDRQHESRESVQPEVRMLDNLDGLPKAEQAIEFLTGLFNVMGVDAAVGVLETSDAKNIRLKITGEDTHTLIGRRGETLDSVQYLTGLILNRGSDEYIRVMIDAENYRQKRQETLERLARRLANNVVRTGRPAKLEPMNPYERRIMHAALQNNDEVETESEGVDPNRYVVIRKK